MTADLLTLFATPAEPKRKRAASPILFEQFWAHYPRRVARLAAERAWANITRRYEPDRIIEAARRYAAKRAGQDVQFTPHPATWLNQGRFLDDDLWAEATPAAASSVVFVSATDPRWRDLAERYRDAKGKNPPLANGGWHFPREWVTP